MRMHVPVSAILVISADLAGCGLAHCGEMGEGGEGSLEPGIASGDTFWVAYQQPFLKYYYAAHRLQYS